MQQHQLRIIGGQYRRRKLSFPDVEGLRPTGDRIRETLFNWLAPHIEGACCLDLFAGSGALGFEALSRGAQQVTFVEQSPEACDYLRRNIVLLKVHSQTTLLHAESLSVLSTLAGAFDIVFLDPPFNYGQLPLVCTRLDASRLLNPGAMIYLEQAKSSPEVALPNHWQRYRDKTSGQVRYQLYQYL